MKFTKGYEVARDKVQRYPKFLRSCFNCDYFYKSIHDKEELCQNTNVLPYDMIMQEGSIYCSFWKLVSTKKEKPKVFQKHQRNDGRLLKAQNKYRMH